MLASGSKSIKSNLLKAVSNRLGCGLDPLDLGFHSNLDDRKRLHEINFIEQLGVRGEVIRTDAAKRKRVIVEHKEVDGRKKGNEHRLEISQVHHDHSGWDQQEQEPGSTTGANNCKNPIIVVKQRIGDAADNRLADNVQHKTEGHREEINQRQSPGYKRGEGRH